MDDHNNTSKDNFQLEVKSLLQQIDRQIQAHSTHMGANQNAAQNKNSRIEKLNTLKVQEYKIREVQNCLTNITEEKWLDQRKKFHNDLEEAQSLLQNSDNIH